MSLHDLKKSVLQKEKKKRNELAGGMSWEKYLSGVILIVQLWKKDIKIQPFLTVTFL